MLRTLVLIAAPAASAHAQSTADSTWQTAVAPGGASATWIFANISYTGMRAQGNPSFLWKLITFVAGFPGS